MADDTKAADSPVGPDAEEARSQVKKVRAAFSKVRRELSEDEFAGPGSPRMLLDRIEQLEADLETARPFQSRFHTADKQCGILEEKLKRSISADVVFGLCLSVGSLLVGLSVPLWQTPPFGYFMLGLGIALFLGSVLSRFIVRK